METRVKPKDDVTVEWTGNDGIHKKGSTGKIHRALFEKLSAKGFAVKVGDTHPEPTPLRWQRNRTGQAQTSTMGFTPASQRPGAEDVSGNQPAIMGTGNTINKTGNEEGSEELPL